MQNQSRREMLKLMVSGAIATATSGCLGPSASTTSSINKKIPNLILIVTDDQGYGDLGCQPHTLPIATPNIDRIAAEGIRMTDGYANAPICSPSRAAILTGRYAQRFGYYDNWEVQVGFDPDQRIAPRLLKPLGYRCAAIGKWHLGWFPDNHPLKMGFDYHYGFNGGMHDYFEPDSGETWEGGPFDVNWMTLNGERVDTMKYMPDELTDRAIEFMDSSKDQPFFIYLAYTTPHGPHQAKDEDLEKYMNADMDPHRKVVRAMYDALDRNVGRVLHYLDANHLTENTLLIYCGDNGGLHREAGCDNWILRGSKGHLTEGGIRIPFLARWPKQIPAGATYTQPIMHLDILPTLLAAAGAPASFSPEMDGTNLLPHWRGEQAHPPHPSLHWQMHHTVMNRWAIREGDWKLVYALNGDGLFNLKDDVSETTDLREKHPEIVEDLTRKHLAWNSRNQPSRVTDIKRRAHIWELRFQSDMGRSSGESVKKVLKQLQ